MKLELLTEQLTCSKSYSDMFWDEEKQNYMFKSLKIRVFLVNGNSTVWVGSKQIEPISASDHLLFDQQMNIFRPGEVFMVSGPRAVGVMKSRSSPSDVSEIGAVLAANSLQFIKWIFDQSDLENFEFCLQDWLDDCSKPSADESR